MESGLFSELGRSFFSVGHKFPFRDRTYAGFCQECYCSKKLLPRPKYKPLRRKGQINIPKWGFSSFFFFFLHKMNGKWRLQIKLDNTQRTSIWRKGASSLHEEISGRQPTLQNDQETSFSSASEPKNRFFFRGLGLAAAFTACPLTSRADLAVGWLARSQGRLWNRS